MSDLHHDKNPREENLRPGNARNLFPVISCDDIFTGADAEDEATATPPQA